MAYTLKIKHAVKSPCYNDPRKMQGQLGVMLHSVGCSQSSADNWAERWNRPTARVCATYVTEPGLAIQTLPETKRPWTSGSGRNGNANNYMIQVEMAEPRSLKYGRGGRFTVDPSDLEAARDYVKRNYWTTVELFADICKHHGIDPTAKIKGKNHLAVISHAEGAKAGVASNHGDPEHLWRQLQLPCTMDTFRADVKHAMAQDSLPPKKEESEMNVKVRLERGTPIYAAASTSKQVGSVKISTKYTIVEKQGAFGRLKSGAGWVRIFEDPEQPESSNKVDAWARAHTLSKGSKGVLVEVLQVALMAQGYDVIDIDGDFGAVTESAVKALQKAKGLVVDGVVGSQTWPLVFKG